MLRSISMLLGLLIVGETLADALGAPVPGSALALGLLTVLIAARGGPDADTEKLFDGFAPVFPLFFVPAAVGVVANLDLLLSLWLQVAVAVVLGTALTIAVTGALAQVLLRASRDLRVAS